MCGRARFSTESFAYGRQFAASSAKAAAAPPPGPALRPAIEEKTIENLGPGSPCEVVVAADGDKSVKNMIWGCVPSWEKTVNHWRLFNCRAETAAKATVWRGMTQEKRGIVCMAGYYEWNGEGAHKRPFYISLVDKTPLLVAAVYDLNRACGQSFAIVTTAAPPIIEAIHNRAPLVLTPAQADIWLHGSMEQVEELLSGETLLAHGAQSWAVTKEVGKISYQKNDCAMPIANVPSPKKQLGIGSFFSAATSPSDSKKRPAEHGQKDKDSKKAAK